MDRRILSSWSLERTPYFCPPLSEISAVLEKVANEGVRCMLVVPEGVKAHWWPIFEFMRTNWCSCMEPLCSLSDGQAEGEVRPACFKPRWKTIFAIINGNGSLAAESSSLDISGGSQNKEDVPDPCVELELAGKIAE